MPANRIIEVYAEKIKAFSATNWNLHSVLPFEILDKSRRLLLLPLLCKALREDSQALTAGVLTPEL